VLACAAALPAICQSQQETDADSWQAREMRACGAEEKEVNYVVATDLTTRPAAVPATDKALVYIVRPGHIRTSYQSKIAVDGEWKGANLGGTYFFLTLEPGLHYFCSKAKSRSLLILTVEAGKTYYMEQQVVFKPIRPIHNLFLLRDADAKAILAQTTPSTWKVQ